MSDVSRDWSPQPLPREVAISYSQNAEDIRLARVFGGGEGFYVDVGAGDPTQDSVTKLFYDRGWSGINVEPGRPFEVLAAGRPRDVNLNVVVSVDEGQRDFWASHPHWGLSTLYVPDDGAPVPDGFTFESMSVDSMPLSRILEEHTRGAAIDFMSIDVEGAEGDVIRSMDFGVHRPRVLVVEAVAPLTFEPNHGDWEPLLREAGYEFAAFDGVNRFYVERDDRELIPALAYPISALEPFVVARDMAVLAKQADTIEAMLASRTWRMGRAVGGVLEPLARLRRRGSRLASISVTAPRVLEDVRPRSSQALALDRVDVSAHNAPVAPRFDVVVSQVVSAGHFSEPDFVRLRNLIFPTGRGRGRTHNRAPRPDLHRKLWEFVYVLRAGEQSGRLRPGSRALGLGVGTEPLPAALASFGMSVVATDLDPGEPETDAWASTDQHMSGIAALSWPDIVSDDTLRRLVETRYVDMNDIPQDLGSFDLIWSCCALEHLGSPQAGIDFVRRTLDLLEPGGVSVHTTELELTARDETIDFGHLAVYRREDLDRLVEDVRARGFEMDTNWYVPLETREDRWIAHPPYPDDDPAHLKLVIGDSVSTSVGVIVRRPV